MNYEESKMNTGRYRKVLELFTDIYGHKKFKEHQYEIINRIINKEDLCCVMPTGYGKTACCVIPAIYTEKPCIIVSPLISLMCDQQLRLTSLNISSICYNSNTKKKKTVKAEIANGTYGVIYVTPESLEQLKETLEDLNEGKGISLFAIDEAHCISSYGCDFRASYRTLNCIKEWFPEIPILAVTATATSNVVSDMQKVLNISGCKIITTSFDRPNIFINVESRTSGTSNILIDILPVLKKHKNDCIIIYCLTKKDTEKIMEAINAQTKISCEAYHAGMDNETRTSVHENFISGKTKCVVATIAFGMGIDKGDVRVVIHYGAPKNIEGYVQEIGRAGRDGEQSYCYLFYSIKDFILNRRFIGEMTNEDYKKNSSKLLLAMEKYVSSKKCLRRYILEYFGNKYDKDNCESCSNCCKKEIEEKTTDISLELLLLINCLKETNSRYGATTTIGILRGSKAKNILEKYRKLDIYGKGHDKSDVWWKQMIGQLIKDGYLKEVVANIKGFASSTLTYTKNTLLWYGKNEFIFDLPSNINKNDCVVEPIKINIK